MYKESCEAGFFACGGSPWHILALPQPFTASRFITGIDIFFNDNFVNLMSVMKSAVAKYGRPRLFNFDNGSSYKNKQMELPAARIGSALNYCRPYTPTAKAKIERWFRTTKDLCPRNSWAGTSCWRFCAENNLWNRHKIKYVFDYFFFFVDIFFFSIII